MSRPKSFSQAAIRRHTRRGKQYDPNDKKEGPWLVVGLMFGILAMGTAGYVGYTFYQKRQAELEEERMRPIRSRQILQEIRDYQRNHSDDDQIEAVRLFIKERMDRMEVNEQQSAHHVLAALKLQEEQAKFRKKMERLLGDVRSGMNDPARVEEVAAKAAELESLLQQIDPSRAEDVKREIFNARGNSAISKAKDSVAKADKMYETNREDYSAILAAYEKADDELADVLVATKFTEAKEVRDSLALRMNEVAEKWAESGRGFVSATPRDLLNPREFQVKSGESKSPWDASAGAKLTLDAGKLVVEGVKPGETQKPGERAGIAFWAPSPTTPIRHYELRMRVKIMNKGFQLVARQGSGYMRHTYEMETLEPGKNVAADDAFVPQEGNVYDIVQRVFGKKIQITVTPKDADEPIPAPVDGQTNAREGGVGIQVRQGARIEIERMEIRILR